MPSVFARFPRPIACITQFPLITCSKKKYALIHPPRCRLPSAYPSTWVSLYVSTCTNHRCNTRHCTALMHERVFTGASQAPSIVYRNPSLQPPACQMLYARVTPSRSDGSSDSDGGEQGNRSSTGSGNGSGSGDDISPAKSSPLGSKSLHTLPWHRLPCATQFLRGIVNGLMVCAAAIAVAAVLGHPSMPWRRHGSYLLPDPFPADMNTPPHACACMHWPLHGCVNCTCG